MLVRLMLFTGHNKKEMKLIRVRKETETDVTYNGRKVDKKDISDRISYNELVQLIIYIGFFIYALYIFNQLQRISYINGPNALHL